MLDPQPTRMELLVRHVLLLREFLPQIGINSNHYGLLMVIRHQVTISSGAKSEGGTASGWLTISRPCPVALARGVVVEDHTDGVKGDDVAEFAHEHPEHGLGIALCTDGVPSTAMPHTVRRVAPLTRRTGERWCNDVSRSVLQPVPSAYAPSSTMLGR